MGGRQVSGRKLAAALAAIALSAFVLPPLAAHQVHVRRIERGKQAVARLAAALGGEAAVALGGIAGPTGRDPYVLGGPGAAPACAQSLGWPADSVLSLTAVLQRLSSGRYSSAGAAIDDSPDPWGNQYLVVVGGPGPKKTVTVISAGPNGTIETPFGIAPTPRADDIVAVR